jgi:hypothetical protein
VDQGAFQNPPSNLDISGNTMDFGETLGTIKVYNRFAILYDAACLRPPLADFVALKKQILKLLR